MILIITLAVVILFAQAYITASLEPESVNSGTNFAMTSIMFLIVLSISSFISLQVHIDDKYLRIKFGYGIFRKKFLLSDILSAKTVKNHRYYGWGIKVRFWPKMRIYSVSGFDAVEIKMKNGKRYRIGTDESKKLEQVILQSNK
jgi:hypothetical protein